MTNSQLKCLLMKLDACKEAIYWVGQRDLRATWEECERAEWLLWLSGKMAGTEGWSTQKQVVLAAIECGRLSLEYAGRHRNKLAEVFDIAERCALNNSPENVIAAKGYAMSAISAAESAWNATVDTWSTKGYAMSAVSAIESAWSAATMGAWGTKGYAMSAISAAESAWNAAESAYWSYARSISARSAIQKRMCEIVRKRLSIPNEASCA